MSEQAVAWHNASRHDHLKDSPLIRWESEEKSPVFPEVSSAFQSLEVRPPGEWASIRHPPGVSRSRGELSSAQCFPQRVA